MRTSTQTYRSGDRAGDPPTIVRGVAKPPVLSRATIRSLCVVCLALVIYGTLGPLGSRRKPWIVPVEHWNWVPLAQPTDLDDVVTNLAVYIPVGIAFRLLVRRRHSAGWPDFVVGLTLSIALSYVTELLQAAMPARVSSLSDVAVNSVAACIGCLCAPAVQRGIRRLHAALFIDVRSPARRWTVAAWLLATAMAVLMTMPWRLTRPSVEWGLHDPLTAADGQRILTFAALGFLTCGAGIVGGRTGWRARMRAFLPAALLAVGLEAAQAVIGGHVCSVRHAALQVGGAVVGCIAAALFVGRPAVAHAKPTPETARSANAARRHARPLRALAGATLVVTAAHTLVTGLWRGGPPGPMRAEPLVHWVPFQMEFMSSFPVLLAGVLDQIASYALLALVCLYLATRRGRGTALLLVLGLVGVIELGQAFFGLRGADTTAPLLALMGWLISTRVWTSLYPRRRERAYPGAPADADADPPVRAGRATNAASGLCDPP